MTNRTLNTALATDDPNDYNPVAVAYQYHFLYPVRNGAIYFDAIYPGWARRVDMVNFNMRSPSTDILAQVHGNDSRVSPEWSAWSDDSLIAHGMRMHSDFLKFADSLTVSWRNAIMDRLPRIAK